MNTYKNLSKTARAIGVMIVIFTGLVMGQVSGVDTIVCHLNGSDLTYQYATDPAFSVTATPAIKWATGGGTYTFGSFNKTYTTNRIITSAPWIGKITVTGTGYIFKFDSLKTDLTIPDTVRYARMSHDTLIDNQMLSKRIDIYFIATKIIVTNVKVNDAVPIARLNGKSEVFFDLSGKKISSAKISTLAVSKNQIRLIGLFGKR